LADGELRQSGSAVRRRSSATAASAASANREAETGSACHADVYREQLLKAAARAVILDNREVSLRHFRH
jgi:hypothetical protein